MSSLVSSLDKKLGMAQNDLLAARGQLYDGKSTSNDDGHQALVDVKVLKVKLCLAESKSADSRQEISSLHQKYASLEQELLETKAVVDESLKIRANLEKQYKVDVQEMTKRYEEELQSNAVKAKVEAYLNELFDEKDSLCAELEAAQAQLQAATAAAPDVVHLLTMHNESEQARRDLEIANTKLVGELSQSLHVLMEEMTAKKLLENELSTCKETSTRQEELLKKELDTIRKQKRLMERQHQVEIETLTVSIREQINARVGEYVKHLENECEGLTGQLKATNAEIARLSKTTTTTATTATATATTIANKQSDRKDSNSGGMDSAVKIDEDEVEWLRSQTGISREQAITWFQTKNRRAQQQQQQQQPLTAAAKTSYTTTTATSTTAPISPTLTKDTVTVSVKIADPDQEALEVALLLSEQEAKYGTNMFDALGPDDNTLIQAYMCQGFSKEEAILIIFEQKVAGNDTSSHKQIMSMVSEPCHVCICTPFPIYYIFYFLAKNNSSQDNRFGTTVGLLRIFNRKRIQHRASDDVPRGQFM